MRVTMDSLFLVVFFVRSNQYGWMLPHNISLFIHLLGVYLLSVIQYFVVSNVSLLCKRLDIMIIQNTR